MSMMCKKHLSDRYEMIFVFANTGKEREETLVFADRCDKEFGLNLVWVEADVHSESGVGTTAKVVDFNSANRFGAPFEDVIKKYGIPNQNQPICSRELKATPIRAYARSIGWKKYYTAIGIRVDEIDRMNEKKEKKRIIYPLISDFPTTKTDINAFWLSMPFDLELKSYEGNCDACWKKSFRKLLTIAKERPSTFDWWAEMEGKYEMQIRDSVKNNPSIKPPLRFFRNNMRSLEFVEKSKYPFTTAKDESKTVINQTNIFKDYEMDVSNGCEDSCEPF